jgi:hypothetical protein
MISRSQTRFATALVCLCLLVSLSAPASGRAAAKRAGACVAVYPAVSGCSFEQRGFAKMTYRISDPLRGGGWEVGLCIAGTFSCVRKNYWNHPLGGVVTNKSCLTRLCYGYLNVGWIGTGYAYTNRI